MSTICTSPSCTTGTAATMKPRYTVSSTASAHTVRIDLPGIPKSGIRVDLEKDILSIQGTGRPAWPETWRLLHQELRSADYSLKLKIESAVQADQIRASHEDGVLILELPIQETAQPRRIELN
jgi:HSP20 family protein